VGAGAGQGKAGVTRQGRARQDRGRKTSAKQSGVGKGEREEGGQRMEEENARGDEVRTHLPLREENVKYS
jgi:hypothetical protein